MKKITKLLLVSATMVLASCGNRGTSSISESKGEESISSLPIEESKESKSDSIAPASTSSVAPKVSSSTLTPTSSTPSPSGSTSSEAPAASTPGSEQETVGWVNDGAAVNDAQPVKNEAESKTGYELVATGKTPVTGSWDNGKLKGDLEWNVTGMSAGRYEIYLKGESSAGNGSKKFIENGNPNTRYHFQADSEADVLITATESYSDLGLHEHGNGTESAWTNKAVAEIDIKDGTAKFTIKYKISGYSIYLTDIRLVRVGDLEPEQGQGTITLADGASTLSDGSLGVTIDNTANEIHITKKGIYVVEGTLTDGSIIVDEGVGDGDVELDLNSVSITREGTRTTSAPITGKHAGKLKVKKDGKNSDSTITDNRTGTKDAAINAKGYLDIPGKGKLTITSTGIGIESDAYIEAKNGTLNIEAGKKGIYARRSVLLGEEGGKFNITSTGSHAVEVEAKDDATFEENELQGVCIMDGEYDLKGSKKGINSDYTVDIQGGEGTIESTGGDRAINAKADLLLSGGEFKYTSTQSGELKDNAIKADLGAIVSGGEHTLESEVKAFVSPMDIEISGGSLDIKKSTEGIEAKNVTINGENAFVTVKSSQNGINATGEITAEEKPTIKIEEGNVYVESLGDGLDSNGDIIVTGGFTLINQSGAGNTMIDYGYENGGVFEQDGGLVVAYGSDEGTLVNSGSQYSLVVSTEGVTTAEYFKISNPESSFDNIYVQPQTSTAYRLYISSSTFISGDVTVSKVSSLTPGEVSFHGFYTEGSDESGVTLLESGTFSESTTFLDFTTPDTPV